VRVGEPIGPDALEEPPERGGIGNIGGRDFTRTAREQTLETAAGRIHDSKASPL
jgi:hypothetical protein